MLQSLLQGAYGSISIAPKVYFLNRGGVAIHTHSRKTFYVNIGQISKNLAVATNCGTARMSFDQLIEPNMSALTSSSESGLSQKQKRRVETENVDEGQQSKSWEDIGKERHYINTLQTAIQAPFQNNTIEKRASAQNHAIFRRVTTITEASPCSINDQRNRVDV